MSIAMTQNSPIGLRVSKSSEVSRSDLALVGTETGVAPRYGEQMLLSRTGPDTTLEISGSKISQRSEFIETDASDDINVEGSTIWYAFSIYIDPVTELPTLISGGPEANISLFQFHQRDDSGASDRPAMSIELDAYGDIIAEFGDAVGKRSYTLVDGGMDGTDAMGQWIDIVIGVEWSTDGSGWMEFHVREEGEAGYTLEHLDTGQNTSTGNVYLKMGVYRNFLERDPALQDSVTLAYYDGLRRADTFAEAAVEPSEGPLAGTDFDDLLRGGLESEFLFANAGDDLILPGSGADLIDGGSGTDTLSYAGSASGVALSLDGTFAAQGEAADDTVVSIENVTGTAHADILFGDGGANTLDGSAGDDDISGRGGNDVLLGGDGADTVFGDSGDDWIDGGAGGDMLAGGSGDDMLIGGAGDDSLSGGSGRDTLSGGTGANVLTGGADSDLFVFHDAADAATDTITDFTRERGERDQIDLSALDLLQGFKNQKAWARENMTYDRAEEAVFIDLGGGHVLRVDDHAGIGAGFENDVYSGLLL